MASTGTLAIKVTKVELAHEDEEAQHKHIQLRFKIANESKNTKAFHPSQPSDQTINFDLKDVAATEDVVIESHVEGGKKHKEAVATWKLALPQFTKSDNWSNKKLTHKIEGAAVGSVLQISTKWTPKTPVLKVAGENAAQALEQLKQVVLPHPQRTLAVRETHRPWFMRVSYYYDTTKNVYNYTTSFRVIAPVARFGESTANTILSKVTGKTLADLDTALVSPSLNTIDNTVDSSISAVLVGLIATQNFVIEKKNQAVGTASVVVGSTLTKAGQVKDYTTSSVKSVASTGYNTAASATSYTYNTAASATNYTTSSIKSVASATYNTAANVTDYTTTQVSNVSSSAFGKVRGATVYVVSHVPYLGAKIVA